MFLFHYVLNAACYCNTWYFLLSVVVRLILEPIKWGTPFWCRLCLWNLYVNSWLVLTVLHVCVYVCVLVYLCYFLVLLLCRFSENHGLWRSGVVYQVLVSWCRSQCPGGREGNKPHSTPPIIHTLVMLQTRPLAHFFLTWCRDSGVAADWMPGWPDSDATDIRSSLTYHI